MTMYNPYSLEGKTILVTGASSGIGQTTAIECSKLGATVIITARDVHRLTKTKESLVGPDRPHQLIAADLTTDEQRKALIDALPPLDGVVSNAGIGKMTPIQFYSLEDLAHVFGVNSFVPMLLLKDLLRGKKLKKSSSIVFTTSVAGESNFTPTNGIYGASKSALGCYMKYAALELAAKGIRCNAVCPACVNTPLIDKCRLTDEDMQRDIAKYPLKRYGEPKEIAHAIIYLLSDAAAWITGSSLIIDGGRSLR